MDRKQLTDCIDTPSTRLFQEFSGGRLEDLDKFDLLDIITVLCRAACIAGLYSEKTISTDGFVETLNLKVSDIAKNCLTTLNGFPTNQVNQLIKALIEVYGEDFSC
jgi:hypothetical protein